MDRWLNTYVVADGQLVRHAAIQDVRRRIDRCVAEELPESCGLSLRHRLDDASPAVWRIRKLHLDFTVDVSAPGAGDVAQAWGDLVAARILEIIGHGVASDEVLCFPNRAAYLAQFAFDLTAGRAWSKWYYEEFRSLDALATGRAISVALTREPEQGARTILHLAESGRLDEILLVLTETDTQAIYTQCFGGPKGPHSSEKLSGWGLEVSPSSQEFSPWGPEASHSSQELSRRRPEVSFSSQELSQWSGRLLAVWNEEPMSPAGAQKNFHTALRWLARGALRFPGAEQDSAASAAVDGLLELRRVLAALRSLIVADRLVRGLAEQKVGIEEAITVALKEGAVAPENGLRFLFRVAEGDGDWAVQAATVLLRDQRPPVHAALAGEARVPLADESMLTLFGGIFLVGPALVKLRVNEIVEAAGGEGEHTEETAAFLRYIVLAKCLGSPRVLEAMADPALRLLSGCHRAHLQDGRQACSTLDPARAQALLARNLPALTGCEGHCLLAEAIRLPSQEGEVVLLRDLARGEWIYATALPHEIADQAEVLISGIDLVRESTGNLPQVLLHPSLARLAESQALRGRVFRLLAFDREEVSSELADVLLLTRCIPASTPPEKFAYLLSSSDQEFAYLSFGSLWPDFDVGLDIVGALLARAALKGFARQLMGFQSSSPEHLYRNFLEGIGTVHNRPDRIEVELPRSPLLLVLQLSGLTKQTYAVPWLEGREVCLLPPRE